MSNIWIPKPPQLEKLLLDADIDPEVEGLLRAVRFRTQSVHRVKVDIQDDVGIVRWARDHGYMVLCHDRHNDFPTKLAWCPEISLYGGQVIEVDGGDPRTPHTTVGQLLARRTEWREWFDRVQHGVVYVHAQGMRKYDQQHLARLVPTVMSLDETVDSEAERLGDRAPPRARKRRAPQRASRRLL